MYNMQQKRTQADCSQLAAFNCKPRWPKRNGTWDATKRNGTEGGNARERGKGNVNWPPSWTTYICMCLCARMQNFIWQICVISPAVPAEGSICASSEISPAAELQVEQTIRSTPAKLAANWRWSRVHAKGLATATAMVVAVAVALPIAAVVGVGVQVEVGLCLSILMSK